ncbi:tyrosine-protein phosphatase [Amycolatopsis sp. H6(2020)]|nr:tyrosine-protein phosphatase [Amycolatopsis sp. H6(2020)]
MSLMVKPRERCLKWPGCFNIRDLGGIKTADGRRRVRWGAVVRGDSPIGFEIDSGAWHAGLTEAGWRCLRDHGIRTIVSLREKEEEYAEARRQGITIAHSPLDDANDTRFWGRCRIDGIDVPPLYFPKFLDEKLERCASALVAIAEAPPGGVFVHCRYGRDRTGLISMVLLALAGVPRATIVEDFLHSTLMLPRMYTSLSLSDDREVLRRRLRQQGTSQSSVLHETLKRFEEVKTRLPDAGFTAERAQKLVRRIVEPLPENGSTRQEAE